MVINILKMDLFLLSMATSFLLFPNLSKIEVKAPDSVILLKPHKETKRSILTAFSGVGWRNMLKRVNIQLTGMLACGVHQHSVQH